ncbi:hypothetical protein [Terrisporobacter vanillatitrophus]|uniref:hypothetical protein n=1 Tax=Terrisporobacter vanillatitrophus TaxID=3058402 RepID=UPI003EBFA69B
MNKTNIDKINLNDFTLPAKMDYDNEYYSNLNDKLKDYERYIENINGISQDTIENVKSNVKSIIESIESYYNADIANAKNKILELLKKYTDNKFIVSYLDKSFAFRGIAPFADLIDERKDGYIDDYDNMNSYPLSFFKARVGYSNFDKKDMLHIPFCRRELVSTQRFSIPGIPCLYLGTTSYVCWLEMDKPQDNVFNVSSFKLPENLKILNLVIDQTLINNQAKNSMQFSDDKREDNIKLLENMIEIFPLVYATSFSIKNKERKFKSDYIVSQLIMQCLSELNIDGIAYASKKVNDSKIAFPQCVNLAIPMKSNKKFIFNSEKDYYANICKDILLTDPVNLSEFIKLGGKKLWCDKNTYSNGVFSYGCGMESNIALGNIYVEYRDTEFANFDKYLVTLEHKKSEIFNNE